MIARGVLPHRFAIVTGIHQAPSCLLVRRFTDSEGLSFVPLFGFGELGRRFRNGNGSLPPAATENLHSAAGKSEQ